MSALTNRLPGNSSRTSTHAMSVPVTMFTTTTTIDTSTGKRIAANACCPGTASQNADGPPVVDSATTAASGMRTTRLRYAVASAPPTAGVARRRRRPARRGRARRSVGAVTAVVLDALHDRVLRVEELLHDAVPATELRDVELLRRVGIGLRVDERRDDGAIALGREDLLCRLGGHVLHERLPLGTRPQRRRDRVLDEDRRVGDDVVELLALLPRGDRLVLVGDEDVALAAREALERLASRLVLDDDVLEELLEVVRRLRLARALRDL